MIDAAIAPPRLALRKTEAAKSIGLSDESFDRYVRPHLSVVRIGSVRLYPVPELERWLRENTDVPPSEQRGD